MTAVIPADIVEARRQALTVPCRYPRCNALVDQVCRNPITDQPFTRLPAHPCRIADSGARMNPQGEPQNAGHPTHIRRHEGDQNRRALEQRRRELQCDIRAGDIGEAGRAELLKIDSVLDRARPEPESDFRRGPGGQQ